MSTTTSPRSFLDTIDRPVALVRAHAREVLPVAILGAFLAQALPMGATWLQAQAAPTPSFEVIGAVTLLGLLGGIVNIIVMLAIYEAIVTATEGRKVSLARSYLAALRPTAFLTLLAVFVLTYMGLFCLLLPGLFAAVVLAFVPVVLVEERGRFAEAFARSFEIALHPYGQSRLVGFVRVVGLLLVFLMVYSALSSIGQVVAAAFGVFEMYRLGAEGIATAQAEFQMRVFWVSLFTWPLLAALAGLGQTYGAALLLGYFRDVRERREGPALEASLAARLEGAPSQSP